MAGPYRKKPDPNLDGLDPATDDRPHVVFTNRLLIDLHRGPSHGVLRIDAAGAPGSIWLWRNGVLTDYVQADSTQRGLVIARLREMSGTAEDESFGRIHIMYSPTDEVLYDVLFSSVTGAVLVTTRPAVRRPPDVQWDQQGDFHQIVIMLRRVRNRLESGAPDEEMTTLVETLWRAIDFLDDPGRLKASALKLQARVAEAHGRTEELPELLMAHASELERLHGATDDFLGTTLVRHGLWLAHWGHYDHAAHMGERGVGIVREALGGSHPHAVDLMGELAVLYSKAGRHAEAKDLAREALPASRALFAGHPFVAELEVLAET